MKKSAFIVMAAVALCLSSCSTLRKTATTENVNNTIVGFPVVADVNVGAERVSAHVEWTNGLLAKNIQREKGNLIADLLKEHNGDVLLEPQFVHFSEGVFPRAFRHHEITVTGYIGTYKNFRKATEEDLHAIEVVGLNTNEPVKANEEAGLLGGFFKFCK